MIEGLVPAHEALAMVLSGADQKNSETLPLGQCIDRVLAKDLVALRTQPPFDASAMDGYAVRQIDIAQLPCELVQIGEAAAGHPFAGTIAQGECARIFTGGPVPNGADTIIIQENTNAQGEKITIQSPSPIGKFIRKAGFDFREGEVLLKTGRVMDAQCLSLAASMNHATIPVLCRPKIAIIATGDELVMPGEKLRDGQIIASNSFGLIALAQKAGGEVLDLGIAIDTLAGLTEKIADALRQQADLIITIGGASVGDHDLVHPAMEKCGFDFKFKKIAMRPGKPLLFATREYEGHTTRMLGLAGNPVSSLIAGNVFARPLINALSGKPPQITAPISAQLGAALAANDERMEYMRAHAMKTADGKIEAVAFTSQDSSLLALLTKANCLIIRPIGAPPADIGEPCQILQIGNIE